MFLGTDEYQVRLLPLSSNPTWPKGEFNSCFNWIVQQELQCGRVRSNQSLAWEA